MNRKMFFVVCLVLPLLIPTSIFAWGYATHVYFADHLGKSWGYWNQQEMYGAMVPDMFNATFGSPYYEYLRLQTHEQFDKIAGRAKTTGLKAFAYGFTSHNDVWGADYTAHHDGRTTPGIGYVLAQANALTLTYEAAIEQVLLDNNIDPEEAKAIAAEFAPSIAHGMVEFAVDILVKRNDDSGIGKRILQAAQLRSPAVPALLVAAYAADFAQEFDLNVIVTTGIILGAEKGFQEFVSYYGYIFTKKEPEIIRHLSFYGAELAELYMKAAKSLNITVPPEAVADLLKSAIAQVESSYAAEIAATLAYLKEELPSHGIESQSQPLALQDEPAIENLVPQEFSLAQNQPNPFNPTTTINYSLANDSHVKITVYNMLGQVVAVLVDEYQAKGSHGVLWNAHYQPSGLYVYRLEADGFVASKKMFLQK
jgi:hypothetical protein